MTLYAEESGKPKPSGKTAAATRFLYSTFLRLLSLAFVGLTILAWLQLIGFWGEGPRSRFDLMDTQWKIYIAVLAVLYPVAAVGLWTTLSWGRVIWFIAIGFQIVAIMQFPESFAVHQSVVLFHLITLGFYLVFELALRVIEKKV
jgi:hypothetical protein